MKITFYGHACFGVQIGEIHILFDPFISGNPAAKAINVEEIPADFIFLSHGHQDHVLDAASIASRTGAKLISNYEIVSWYQGQGFDNVHPL
ncbi:MAG: MBL fold metallo-hydrolase, partial [Bacteroidota bacterium]